MLWSRSSFALAGWALLAACGSDPAPQPTTQAGSSGDTTDQVLDDCARFAQELCTSAAACCSTVATFVVDDCVTSYVAEVCMPSAQLVAAGLATYDASSLPGCLAAHQSAFDVCVADWEQTLAIRRELWASCHAIDGTLAEGQPCDDDARCALPEGETATSACVQGVCRKIALLGADAPCPYPNGDVSTCDLGLTCTAGAAGELGTCIAATPEGAACDPVPLNTECGLGFYCDLTDASCKKATALGGEACAQDTECVSFVCDRVLHVCNEPLTTAASLCGAT